MAAVLERSIEKIARVTEKGQTTVPKQVRDVLGIAPGDNVAFVIMGSAVTLQRASVQENDPVVSSFLDFLAKDMTQRPYALESIPASLVARMRDLTAGVDSDPNGEIEGDVGL
jgi:antitoxin PrlF